MALAPLLPLACGDDLAATSATVSATGTGTTTDTGTTGGTATTGTTGPTTTAGSISESQGTSSSTTGLPTTTAPTTTEGVSSTTDSTTTTDSTSTTDTTTTGSTTDTTTTGTTTDTTTTGTTTDTSTTGPVCVDGDKDGHGEGCDLGPDCDDADPVNFTPEGCANCSDFDSDTHWVGCDLYDDNKPGPDCDDGDPYNFTPEGCANCFDMDGDNHWSGCDLYDDNKLGPDCDDTDPYNHTPQGCVHCLDSDGDNYWTGCDLYDANKLGPDCDDTDFNNHNIDSCVNCVDMDGDGHWVGCDQYGGDKPGPDCDDADFNKFTPEGCANCVDMDGDGVWIGCDQYDDAKPGPDCNDGNPGVGLGPGEEICNGLAENCAGEVDPLPADEMCPTQGNPPNVDSWKCEPPAPGQDGCKIGGCTGFWYDVNANPNDGCECLGTQHGAVANATCSEAAAGKIGAVIEGDILDNLPFGTIPQLDNGIGNGAEDWYWVEFPQGNPRPNGGVIRVEFEVNEDDAYRFQILRNCFAVPFDNGLATQFGPGAPPAREWWFWDNHAPNAKYVDNVGWPGKVFIRVFRIKNINNCGRYKLHVRRDHN